MRFNTVLLLFYKLMYIAVCCTLLCLNVKCLAPAMDFTNKGIVSILLLFVQLETLRKVHKKTHKVRKRPP